MRITYDVVHPRQHSLRRSICGIGYCTARIIHEQLLAVQEATKITKNAREQRLPLHDDDVKLATLEKLLSNESEDIVNAAVKLIAERAVRGPTYARLLKHIMGKNEKQRNRALTALCFLHERVEDQVVKPNFSIFKAIICCLCTTKMNEEARMYEEERMKRNECYYRTQHYNDALRLLRLIMNIPHGIKEALRAGLVSDWLANYPWYRDGDSKNVLEIVKNRMRWPQRDANMSWILREAAIDKRCYPSDENAGIAHLIRYGLFEEPKYDEATADRRRNRMLLGMVQPPVAAPHPMSNWTEFQESFQPHEESEEEVMLRRRRREAIIIQEDGQSQNSADIIQRFTSDMLDSSEYSPEDLELVQRIRDEVSLVELQDITH